MELLHTRGIFTAPFTLTPIKFRDHVLPEFFTCTAYFIDNKGKKVTNNNFKTFKTWSVEILIKISKNEVVEVVRMTLTGAKTFKGHIVATTKQYDPTGTGAIHARHYDLAKENRAKLMGYAVTVAIQSNLYKKSKDGGHTWTLSGRKEIAEAELNAVMKLVENRSYERKLDDEFYRDFSYEYLEAVQDGLSPIVELSQAHRFNKSRSRIQAYATEARERGFLPKTDPGKVSTTRSKGVKK